MLSFDRDFRSERRRQFLQALQDPLRDSGGAVIGKPAARRRAVLPPQIG